MNTFLVPLIYKEKDIVFNLMKHIPSDPQASLDIWQASTDKMDIQKQRKL